MTDNDHDQSSDDVTRETTSAFPRANFLNEPDALPTWAPTTRSPVEGLPPGSALLVVKRGPNAGSQFLLLTVASGKKRAVLARHVRNRRLYDAIDQWALCALTNSPGARAF